jgi:hypothetical protein
MKSTELPFNPFPPLLLGKLKIILLYSVSARLSRQIKEIVYKSETSFS